MFATLKCSRYVQAKQSDLSSVNKFYFTYFYIKSKHNKTKQQKI